MKKFVLIFVLLGLGYNAFAVEADVNSSEKALQLMVANSKLIQVTEDGNNQGQVMPALLSSILVPTAGGSYRREVSYSCDIAGNSRKMKCTLKQDAHFGSVEITFGVNIRTNAAGDIEVLALENTASVTYSNLP